MYIDPTGHWQTEKDNADGINDSDRSPEAQVQILEATKEYLEAQARGDKDAMEAAHQKAIDARNGNIYYADSISETTISNDITYILNNKSESSSAKADLKISDMSAIASTKNNRDPYDIKEASDLVNTINQKRKDSNVINPNTTAFDVNNINSNGWFSTLLIENGNATVTINNGSMNYTYDAIKVKNVISSITSSNSTNGQKQTVINFEKAVNELITNGTISNIKKGSFEYYALIASVLEMKDNYDKACDKMQQAALVAFGLTSMRFMSTLEAMVAEETIVGNSTGIIARETIDALSDGWGIKGADLKMSQTVQNHFDDIIKKGIDRGMKARPFVNSNGTSLLLDEIMAAGKPIKDTILKSGLSWKVNGTFNGTKGIWELVVDTATNTIVHFNFVK